jgi:hypothetical protein
MATVQLADIYDATVYQDLAPVNSPESSAFFSSGVATRDALLDSLANGEGKKAELPFWKDLDHTVEPNLTSDDPSATATAQKAEQAEQDARKAFLNQGYSATDLARELQVGDDALQHIRNRFGEYWMKQWQARLMAATEGVYADNVANDSGDMVHDIASESIAGQSASTQFSDDAFIEAAFTMGDMVDGITAIGVHSTIAKKITQLNGAEDVRDSEGNLLYQAYKGRRIIVNDLAFPAIAGSTDGFKYRSVLFGTGAFGYGEGTPIMPVELEREASQGNGGGVETLWERKTWLLHPFGFSHTGTPAATSFTNTELKAATSWDRIVERKNVPLAFLVTN